MYYDDSDWGAEPFVNSPEANKPKQPEHARFLGALCDAEKLFVEQLVKEFPNEQAVCHAKSIGTKFHVTVYSKYEHIVGWITWMLHKRKQETEGLNTRLRRDHPPIPRPKFEQVITDSGTIYWQMTQDDQGHVA